MARPPIDPQTRKDKPLMLMLTAEQKAIIKRNADAEGLGMSAWIRRVALLAAGAETPATNGKYDSGEKGLRSRP